MVRPTKSFPRSSKLSCKRKSPFQDHLLVKFVTNFTIYFVKVKIANLQFFVILGHNGTPALTCSHKAASGFIYPLERGLIFIYKPPIFLRYDEIKSVVFERSGGSTRSFDISVSTKNDISYTFSSIEKNEYGKLYEFMKSKKVNVKTSGKIFFPFFF